VSERRIFVIDDDLMSREVITMLAEEAGFEVAVYESGEAALKALQVESAPIAMAVDMQMPGLSGNALAAELRAACGTAIRLIAMSGSAVTPERHACFDDFLLKPFDQTDLERAIAGESHLVASGDGIDPALAGVDPAMLNVSTFVAIQQTMSKAQVWALYTMCLDDANARLETVRKASQDRDMEAFCRAAHSIKGGCGMVGAVELARIAASFEENGLPTVHTVVPFDDFLEASARLRGMLERVLNDL
jgi:CheY-like chemotaxis protein